MSIRIRDRSRRVLALLIPALCMVFNLQGASASDPDQLKAAKDSVVAARYEIKGRHRTDSRISSEDAAPSPRYTVSFDGGVTWQPANSGLPAEGIVLLVRPVIDPSNPDLQYISIESSGTGVYKTSDGGESWKQLTNGLPPSNLNPPPGPTQLPVWDAVSIAMLPQDASTVFVGISGRDPLGGLYKSTDGGGSFTHISAVPNGWLITIDPQTPSTMYAVNNSGSPIESLDSGATWDLMSTRGLPSGGGVSALAVDPQSKLYLGWYLADDAKGSGIYLSTDSGAHWAAGETDIGVHEIDIDPLRPSVVFGVAQLDDESAASGQGHGNPRRRTAQSLPLTGVIKSVDGGQTWASVNGGLPMFAPALYQLGIDPLNGDNLYLGTSNLMFKSSDGGQSWNHFGAGWFPTDSPALVVDPKREGTVYAAALGFGTGPQVQGASIIGKQLIVTGQNFQEGTQIMLNGRLLVSWSDPQNPESTVYSTKGAKKIAPGGTVELRVMTPDDTESNAYMFTRPSN
jgi:photosystem II stability/assembly factor-like uncharacterized protein